MNRTIPNAMIFFSVLIGLFLSSNTAFSRTEITGAIDKDTKWTADQSPYILSGNVVLEAGVALAIERNSIVVFSRGSRFQVKGQLDAYRVFFNGFFKADNEEVLHYFMGSSGKLIRSAFLDVSLVFDSSDIHLTSSVVSNRNGTGVTIGKEVFPHISDTSFHGNSYFAVYYTGNSPVKITNCFWGSEIGPFGEGDGDGDAVSANILYSPFQPKEKISFLILAKMTVQTGNDSFGESIQLTYHLYNMNHSDHEAVLGASLHGPDNYVVHHPESDIHTTISSGFHTYNRIFKMPSYTQDGAYDVHCGIMNKDLNEYYAYVRQKGEIKVQNSRLTAVKRTLQQCGSDG